MVRDAVNWFSNMLITLIGAMLILLDQIHAALSSGFSRMQILIKLEATRYI